MCNNYIYFLPILINAYTSAHPKESLRAALAQIERLGRQPENREGYEQYLYFVDYARPMLEEFSTGRISLNDLLFHELMKSSPDSLHECIEHIQSIDSDTERIDSLSVMLFKDDQSIGKNSLQDLLVPSNDRRFIPRNVSHSTRYGMGSVGRRTG